jgi:phosphohistidine swiveling domain-containing protein
MGAHLAVVWPRPLGGTEAWTDAVRLRQVVAQLLDRPTAAIDLTVEPATTGEILGRDRMEAALWLPHGAVPTEACRRMVLRGHGVGVWTGVLEDPWGPRGRAYSFGPQALEAYAQCVRRGCGPGQPNAAAAARHLVQYHRVPLAGPRVGLAQWRDGEQRARLLLGGKDVALRRLAALLTGVRVDTGLSVSWREWASDPGRVHAAIAGRYGHEPLIIRSCADGEDGWERSGAGAFASVPVPAPAQPETVASAVGEVFASYGRFWPEARVLVQRWLNPVQAAGVVTTRTLAGAPYYTATVDLVSGRTDTVTSGYGKGVETWYVRRTPAGCGPVRTDRLPPAVAQLLDAAVETEVCAGTSRLDAEVALVDGAAHLLQARPLAAARRVDDAAVEHVMAEAARQVERLILRRVPGLGGAPVVLSNMADWNPAEMLGRRPSPLAVSLYRVLITDRTWAVQRAAYGYCDLRGIPLLHQVAGSPYIDAAASLASFIPAGVEEPLAQAVLTATAEQLAADPTAHDKVEFEIAATCWTPHVAQRTAYLAGAGIGSAARRRLAEHLLIVTRRGIDRLPADAAAMDRTGWPTAADARPETLGATLAIARTAAVRFAHLARAAFVATDLLGAIHDEGLAERGPAWMRGLGTVTAVLQQDAARTAAGHLAWEEFVDRYRWMRPGTYDLTVPAYGDDPDGYLRPLLSVSAVSSTDVMAPWTAGRAEAVTRAVAPLGVDARGLEAFCRAAITGRERGKAAYAAWVSAVLEAVAARGSARGIDRESMRHLHIGEVLATHPGRWPGLIARRRARTQVCALAELPDVITGVSDLDCFARGLGRTNFVGTGKASGPVHTAPTPVCPPPPGAVIVLEAADPGYDWIFAHHPAALVTAYGGANSHMAIRCAELGIPAAIGTGPALHASCAAARRLAVDAGGSRVDVLS